jgi:cysteine sulfinate desulfinase/cysteine desulfurase-like protein
MLRLIGILIQARLGLSAIVVGTEKACPSSSSRESHVMTAIGVFAVTNRQHARTFLQHSHYRRFLAIAFSEIKLG